MPLKDLTQLNAEIDAAIHTDGVLKTTGAGLNALLKSLAQELVTQSGLTGVAHRSTSTLTFEQDAEYNVISSGTFTVDDSTKRVGVVVAVYLGPGATAPDLPSEGFQSKDVYIAGKNLMYMFKVGANGSIQFTITVLD